MYFTKMIQIIYFIIFIEFVNLHCKADNNQLQRFDGLINSHDAPTYYVSILSISYQLFIQQSDVWGYEYPWDPSWICNKFVQGWQKENEGKIYLVVSPDYWVNAIQPESTRCEWVNYARGETKCSAYFNELKWTHTELQNMKNYEPEHNFNQKLLEKVVDSLAMECSQNGTGIYKIKLFTNFAEKSLAKNLAGILQNSRVNIADIEVFPMTLNSANYYFQALNITKESEFRYFDRYILDNTYLMHLNRNWHQIYIFALSTNLTHWQQMNAMEAAKSSINWYFSQQIRNRPEPISVMLVGKHHRHHLDEYLFCEELYKPIEMCYVYVRLSADALFDAALVDYESDSILKLATKSMENYHFKILGAQLPPEQMDENIKGPPLQSKPRLVLITDFVEMQFLDSKLPNQNGFEFKVYALNNVTFEHFQGKADVVILMDPDNPGKIPFTREQEEYASPTEATPKNEEKAKSSLKNVLIISISFGSSLGMIILLISVIIYRRRLRQVNWLHRLEQFKTQHLFDAYMNEKRNSGKEKADCWEIGWDRVILTMKKLGQGAFGEVRKAMLTECNGETGILVAVKMPSIYSTEIGRQNILHEIKIMKLLGNGHQCVVKLLGCMSKNEGGMPGIVLEYCSGGNLLEYLKKIAEKGNNTEDESLKSCSPFCRWAWQVADGMVFLASKNLVHRDLAARNVLLDGNLIAKISDFGLCISLDEKQENVSNEKLPLFLLAPECHESRKFTEKSDAWSYGLLLHEIYTFGTNPFSGIELANLLPHLRNYRPRKPEYCSELIFDIMQQCLAVNIEERLRFAEIKKKMTKIMEMKIAEYGYLALELDTPAAENENN